MPVNRFYLDDPLEEGTTVALEGAEQHHAAKVVRCTEGDTVELVNGRGCLAQGLVRDVQRRTLGIEVTSSSVEVPPEKKIILLQAFPRKNRLDTIVEKATELGADALYLFPAALSERSFTSHDRVVQGAVSAMKQCGRLFLPEVYCGDTLPEILEVLAAATIYYGSFAEGAPPFHQRWKEPEGDVAFVIGPESGLTEQEEELLQKSGAEGVSLHPWILRTDTAAIGAMMLIKYWRHYQ